MTADAPLRNRHEQASRDFQRLEPALRRLAEYPGAVARTQLADTAGLSVRELERVLARWSGTTPDRFIECASRAAIRSQVRTPTRRGHARGAYRVQTISTSDRRATLAGASVRYGFHPSPFGEALLLVSEHGLCALGFVSADDRDATYRELTARFPRARFEHAPLATAPLAARVFSVEPGALPLLLCGTPFQLEVWRALLEIPSGALCTYQALAAGIDAPRAARAVGSANGANPIAYVVPCHRLVRTSGELSGYYWGLARKLAMIGAEAIRAGGES